MEYFFEPRGIAVIGASPTPEKGGNIIINNLRKGYQGEIFPVNPRYDEIEGLKSYPSVLEVPDPVDMAIIYVGARMVPQAIEECGRRGIRGVMLQAAGFSESGPEGELFQEQAAEAARRNGVRIWGPNCMGLVDAVNRNVFSTVAPSIWSAGMTAGSISLIVQSGMLAGAFLIDVMTHGTSGISKACSIGNKMDIHECDILEYLMHDPDTDVVGMYLESISDGPRFISLCRKCEKPIVVLKGGKSAKGAEAALSHTASLAGNDAVVSGVLAQASVVKADDFFQMMDLCTSLAAYPTRSGQTGNRVAIMTYSGGAGIVSTDFLESRHLELAALSPQSLEILQKVYPPWMPPANPMDLWPGIIGNGAVSVYNEAVRAACSDPGVDGIFLHCFVGGFGLEPDLPTMSRLAAEARKPMVCWISGEREAVHRFQVEARELNVPAFREVYRAVECLGAILQYQESAEPAGTPGSQELDLDSVSLPEGACSLDEYQSKQVLGNVGFPVVEEAVAKSARDAAALAASMGFPVVLKGLAPDMIHKTEAGLVRLGISTASQAENVYRELDEAMAGRGDVLVQAQVESGLELILGMVRDPQFGPCVMIGLGGILAEALQDRVFASAPLSHEDGLKLIGRLKSQELLNGFRGARPVDREALASTLALLSRLGVSCSRISEIDINPMIIRDGLPVAVDATIIVREEEK